MTTVSNALPQAENILLSAGIEEARLEAEVIVGHTLQIDRSTIYAYPEMVLSQHQQDLLLNSLEQRKKREPLAYILGYREFYGLKLLITPNVMIPRPETEMLVEKVLNFSFGMKGNSKLIIGEPGTGSGAISIALSKYLPSSHIFATDISSEAIQVAQMNVQRFKAGNKITLLTGDLLQPIFQQLDMIVANLPYIPHHRLPTLQPEVLREPRIALDGGIDGLKIIRRLLHQAHSKLRPGGIMLLEIDSTQPGLILEIAQSIFPKSEAFIEKDLGGLDRIFCLQRSQNNPKLNT